ncbi:TetR/AcrR family transcriptional regulator [Acidisarcina polymorpha]|uniref:TetR/AcrR family transcriptional regulator n=1 Tax=Acidisarcina polymorpha TaxID=2211140 RepID=UPI0023AA5BD8|nr:TetR/AcrR family transcriptional regulator [Acidisarcina polymorpha]
MVERTPKATMVAEKDRAIVRAAHKHFLSHGFAGASMDAIATSAGVSVKTIYSHFEDKEVLFSHVMVSACTDHLLSEKLPSDEALADRFPWFAQATQSGLTEAGRTYLGHLLSAEQLALYRVVTQDSARFPELGRQYQKNFAKGRTAILVAYLKGVAQKRKWTRRDPIKDAALYEALLRTGIFEEALHGLLTVTEDVIDDRARSASRKMWKFFSVDCK